MASESVHNVAILQGNATVAGVMQQCLEQIQDVEVEFLRGSPPGAARAQLVIIDVDSGEDAAEQWIHHCDGRQLPVLLSGVENSRSAYTDRPWLSRPFSPSQLRNHCFDLLDVDPPSEQEDDGARGEEIPPAIEVDPDKQRKPTVEIPAADDSLEETDEPPTQDDLPTARKSPEELLDIVDLDGSSSMILEIEELADQEEVGGRLVDEGQRRRYGVDELVDENPWEDEPDTAVDISRDRSPTGDRSSTGKRSAKTEVSNVEKPSGSAPSLRAEVTAVSTLGELASNDFSGAHRVASLVAEHWDRLGLTARPTDRADRLQRVLRAMLRDGLDGVLDELKRIPPVSGFSGRLETMPVVDLLHTIRDRGLRGRLEVGLDGHSFVLYIERTTLQGIDSLGENTAGLLIDFLRQTGALDERTHRHYEQLLSELSGEPLEMKMRRDGAVDNHQLMEAKKERAKYLLAKMCRGQHGTFAFIELPLDSGHSWPTKELKLDVDALLLELLRKEAIDDGQRKVITRSNLVIDAERASRLGKEALTEREQQMLEFFEEGRTIESARKAWPDSEESVERVVRRLQRLELLRRLGKKGSRGTGAPDEGAVAPPENADDPQQRPTAVSSSWNLEILDEVDAPEETVSEAWPDPLEAGPTEETAEDAGFSAGVPEDFSEDFSDSGSAEDRDASNSEPGDPFVDELPDSDEDTS